jgi:hypothetical protein
MTKLLKEGGWFNQQIKYIATTAVYLTEVSNLGKEGFDDWKHLSTRLKTHETSADHQRAMHSSGCETLYSRFQRHPCCQCHF